MEGWQADEVRTASRSKCRSASHGAYKRGHVNGDRPRSFKIAVDSSGASEKRKIDLVETFNYLIGLRIAQYVRELSKGYAFLDGTLPNGEKAFVLWRDWDKVNDAELNKLLAKLGIKPGATEYDVIYVNGDHAVANVSLGEIAAGKVLKVRQIENEFLDKMFAAD